MHNFNFAFSIWCMLIAGNCLAGVFCVFHLTWMSHDGGYGGSRCGGCQVIIRKASQWTIGWRAWKKSGTLRDSLVDFEREYDHCSRDRCLSLSSLPSYDNQRSFIKLNYPISSFMYGFYLLLNLLNSVEWFCDHCLSCYSFFLLPLDCCSAKYGFWLLFLS